MQGACPRIFVDWIFRVRCRKGLAIFLTRGKQVAECRELVSTSCAALHRRGGALAASEDNDQISGPCQAIWMAHFLLVLAVAMCLLVVTSRCLRCLKSRHCAYTPHGCRTSTKLHAGNRPKLRCTGAPWSIQQLRKPQGSQRFTFWSI